MQLSVRDLSVRRGSRQVLRDVTFSVAGGEGLILTGPNGAGKTTLIRTIGGLLRPEGGSIELAGGAADVEVPQQCHLIGHQNGIKASLTVRENVHFWARYLGGRAVGDARSEADVVEDALDRMRLAAIDDLAAGYLSAGQKRRLGLSRLLVAHRPIWLLDEPTVSLDVASQRLLADLIGEHRKAGGMVIAATHIPLGVEGARELRLNPAGGEGAAVS